MFLMESEDRTIFNKTYGFPICFDQGKVAINCAFSINAYSIFPDPIIFSVIAAALP